MLGSRGLGCRLQPWMHLGPLSGAQTWWERGAERPLEPSQPTGQESRMYGISLSKSQFVIHKWFNQSNFTRLWRGLNNIKLAKFFTGRSPGDKTWWRRTPVTLDHWQRENPETLAVNGMWTLHLQHHCPSSYKANARVPYLARPYLAALQAPDSPTRLEPPLGPGWSILTGLDERPRKHQRSLWPLKTGRF